MPNLGIVLIWTKVGVDRASQVVLVVKNLPANAGDIRDTGSIPGSGRSPGEWHGNPLQYSCLENPLDKEPGGLRSAGLQSWTRLKGPSSSSSRCRHLVIFTFKADLKLTWRYSGAVPSVESFLTAGT